MVIPASCIIIINIVIRLERASHDYSPVRPTLKIVSPFNGRWQSSVFVQNYYLRYGYTSMLRCNRVISVISLFRLGTFAISIPRPTLYLKKQSSVRDDEAGHILYTRTVKIRITNHNVIETRMYVSERFCPTDRRCDINIDKIVTVEVIYRL